MPHEASPKPETASEYPQWIGVCANKIRENLDTLPSLSAVSIEAHIARHAPINNVGNNLYLDIIDALRAENARLLSDATIEHDLAGHDATACELCQVKAENARLIAGFQAIEKANTETGRGSSASYRATVSSIARMVLAKISPQ